MTANLRTAIEQLLLRPDGPADQASELLRARLVADFSEALEGKGDGPGTESEAGNDQFLNDVAAYLEGPSSAKEPGGLIEAITRSPERRAELESAARFLEELEPASEPMPPDLLAEATALFAAPQTAPPRTTSIVQIERPRPRPMPTYLHIGAGIAAIFLVGLIGSGSVLMLANRSDEHRSKQAREMQIQAANVPAVDGGIVQTRLPAPADEPSREPPQQASGPSSREAPKPPLGMSRLAMTQPSVSAVDPAPGMALSEPPPLLDRSAASAAAFDSHVVNLDRSCDPGSASGPHSAYTRSLMAELERNPGDASSGQAYREACQNYTEALRWYERAAELGNAASMVNLGLLYASGRGVPQDYAHARFWFEKAAGLGNAGAMVNLGLLYAQGRGGPQDYTEARRWYEMARNSGDADAARRAAANLATLNAPPPAAPPHPATRPPQSSAERAPLLGVR
jgi:tetratricopeptide (TPR) repeat protein